MEERVITVLGASGSIGRNTLDIIERYPDYYQVYALTADKNIEILAAQCAKFKPRYAVVSTPSRRADFKRLLDQSVDVEVLVGDEGLEQVVTAVDCDTVIAGITGIAGLAPTLAAAQAGKRILLANKEALITAGQLLMDTVMHNQATLIPVDSEHCGLFQCLGGIDTRDKKVDKLILTASGGPFLRKTPAQLHSVSPEEACAHPNWTMGQKISIDSATMMNKGLEVIEARWLFNMPSSQIEVLIHPQSIVHAIVVFEDGSQLAQLSKPDMRVSLACGLAWPDRIDSGTAQLDLAECGKLEFEHPDLVQFPCLGLAYQALQQSDATVIALNAANEVVVEAFLDGGLGFNQIPTMISSAIDAVSGSTLNTQVDNLAAILDIDQLTRGITQQLLAAR